MPLYEYKCSKCEKVHEVIQKFADAPLETCPDCAGALTKLMSMSSFSLKGSGWYTTDYKKSSGPSPVAASSASPAASGSSEGNLSSSEPGKKADTASTGSAEGRSAAAETKSVEKAPATPVKAAASV